MQAEARRTAVYLLSTIVILNKISRKKLTPTLSGWQFFNDATMIIRNLLLFSLCVSLFRHLNFIGYQNTGLRVVTGYYWLPLFRSRIGYRLPLVTKFDDLDRLTSVTNFLTEAGVQNCEIEHFCS